MTTGYESYRTAELNSKRLRDIAHAELSKYRECQRCLERQREKITRQESRINAVVKPLKNPDTSPAIQFTSDPKAVEDLLINAAELRKLYARKIAYSEFRMLRIEKLVSESNLSADQELVIDQTYLHGLRQPTQTDISRSIHYGRTRIFELKCSALERIGRTVSKQNLSTTEQRTAANTREHLDTL